MLLILMSLVAGAIVAEFKIDDGLISLKDKSLALARTAFRLVRSCLF
jgi:hypothetical protein